jgi:succinate-acetate transporter protein
MAIEPSQPSGDMRARVMVRPIGSAVPLGLSGLAVASLLFSAYDLGWIDVGESALLGALLLATGGALQAVGALLSFLGRDGSTGSAMGLLSCGWTSVALSHLLTPPGSTSGVLGVLLLGIGGMLLLSTVSVAMSKTVVAAAIALAGARYVLTGIYQLSANSTWQDVSGIVGLVVVAVAAYTATALELEDAFGATVLPVGRRGYGRLSMRAPLPVQLDGVEHEPGVRRRL